MKQNPLQSKVRQINSVAVDPILIVQFGKAVELLGSELFSVYLHWLTGMALLRMPL